MLQLFYRDRKAGILQSVILFQIIYIIRRTRQPQGRYMKYYVQFLLFLFRKDKFRLRQVRKRGFGVIKGIDNLY